MRKFGYSMMCAALLFLTPVASLSADDLAFSLEYYRTRDADIVDSVRMIRLAKEKQKQKLFDDLIIADESSRRTISALLEIFERYESEQLRRALPDRSRVFSQTFTAPLGSASSRAATVSGKGLYCQFNVRSKGNRHVSAGISVVYEEQEIYSGAPAVYPMDQFIILHERISRGFFSQGLEMLLVKITDAE